MKTLWLVCIIVLLSAVAIIAFSSNQAAPPQVSLAQDAYPLYSGAKWSAPREERFVIGTTTFSGRMRIGTENGDAENGDGHIYSHKFVA